MLDMLLCSLDLAPNHESHFHNFYFPETHKRFLVSTTEERTPPHSNAETETSFCARKVAPHTIATIQKTINPQLIFPNLSIHAT